MGVTRRKISSEHISLSTPQTNNLKENIQEFNFGIPDFLGDPDKETKTLLTFVYDN